MTSISSDDSDPTIPIDQPTTSLKCSAVRAEEEEEEEGVFVMVEKDKVPPVPTRDPPQKIATTVDNIIKTDVVERLRVVCGFAYYGGVAGAEVLAEQGKVMVEQSKVMVEQSISWLGLDYPFNRWASGLDQVKFVFDNFDASRTQVIKEMWI